MTWLLGLAVRPFLAVGRALVRLFRKLFLAFKLAALFTVAVVVLDAVFNRDEDREDREEGAS